jgi:hypothetical protein
VLPMTDRPGELSMIMQRLADASVNLRFIYLATDTRVVIGPTTSPERAPRSSLRRTSQTTARLAPSRAPGSAGRSV